jgi:hypothetical protein
MENKEIFGYPNVGTYGLGHSLLAWARCRIWCDEYKLPMLAPNWLHVQHRIGPFLRRERDNRQYHRLFHFPGYITGLSRQYLLIKLPRIDANVTEPMEWMSGPGSRIVEFSNLPHLNEETYFPQIVGHGLSLRDRLLEITRPVYRPKSRTERHVAVHVRMGDFNTPASVDQLKAGARNSRIPLSWFSGILQGLRQQLGDMPVMLYSDGSDEALSELLEQPMVTRPPKQASIADMLGMSQAEIVISSGSGFSTWGAFLGHLPRISFPGQRFVRVLPQEEDAGELDLEPECETASDLSGAFLDHIARRLDGSVQKRLADLAGIHS